MSTGSSNRTEQPQNHHGSDHRKGTGDKSQNTPVLEHFSASSMPQLPALPRTPAMSPVEKQDDELEHSQGAGSMEPQSEKTDLLVINSKLIHAQSEGRITDMGCILRELKELPIVNKDLLSSTGIYIEVRRTSSHADPSLKRAAQSLFEDWSVLFFPVDKILNDMSATTCITHSAPDKRWILDITSQLAMTMTTGQTLTIKRILHTLGERSIMEKKLLHETSIFETVFHSMSHSLCMVKLRTDLRPQRMVAISQKIGRGLLRGPPRGLCGSFLRTHQAGLSVSLLGTPSEDEDPPTVKITIDTACRLAQRMRLVRGRREHENFARIRRDEHNYVNL
jgi:hypothetical protein